MVCPIDWKKLTILSCSGDALDAIVEEALGLQQEADGKSGGKGILSSIGSTIASLQKFSRSLSR